MLDKDLKYKLQQALTECELLRQENAKLRALLKLQPENKHANEENKVDIKDKTPNITSRSLSTEAKIVLFRSLFFGRDDVYAIRWESKGGRTGYSPAYANKNWSRCKCQKQKVRCPICNQCQYLPLSNQVIYDHLTGICTVGVYPLLKDENCWFLAMDFDKSTWQQDVKALIKTCHSLSISTALERSQSGNGAHLWFFFKEAIPAFLARKLGCGLLTRTMVEHHQLSFTSYDRLFPNQDTLPKGGFGNLIALPLQGHNRKKGNSVFLNEEFGPHVDQWEFLNSVKKLSLQEINDLIEILASGGDSIDIRKSLSDEDNNLDPWLIKSEKIEQAPKISEPLPNIVNITLSNLIYVETTRLPSILLNCLKKLAAFQNPEFYKAQAMRLSTHNKPRIISCAEDFTKYVGLPRGCLSDTLNLFEQYNIRVKISNETFIGEKISVNFYGKLREQQLQAINELYKHDIGILAAATAFGKTITAIYMIAKRQVNTLILVHRSQLLEQWRERLSLFLNIASTEIGVIGAGKRKITNKIDIAMLQTLFQKGNVDNLINSYGHIIIDECHHVSAFSFEQVMKQIKARYILGLTATLTRKDGHHPIILMQCGPIRYQANKNDNQQRQLIYRTKIRHTNFNMPFIQEKTGVNEIYTALTLNDERNELIFNDILESLEQKRSPLLLTERTQHLELFAEKLRKFAKNVIVLKGGLGKKQLTQITEQIRVIPVNEERIILATGRYIGEGFDDARLDTLFLTMPISWHGTLQQYVGRLHRYHNNKNDVLVYDYVDRQMPVLLKMYKKRLKKYKAIGYKIEGE